MRPPYKRLFEPKMVKNVHSTLRKFHTQVLHFHLQPFRHNSLLKCALQPKIARKNIKTSYFEGSGSFKVIDVDTIKKFVTNVCCD